MPRGGARPGAGRPKGSRDNSRVAQLKRATEAAQIYLRTEGHSEFPGDGLDFLVSVYKNQDMPVALRVHCAVAAAVYERPRLVASATVTKHLDGGDDAAFGRLFAQIEAKLALAPPERRAEVIELLREDETALHNSSE